MRTETVKSEGNAQSAEPQRTRVGSVRNSDSWFLNSGVGKQSSRIHVKIRHVQGSYVEIPPSPRLMPYVECYWSLQEGRGTPGARIFPDGCVDILFSTLNREPVSLEIAGLMTTPFQCGLEVGRSFFGVRFRPGMAAAFMRNAALLTDKVEPLEAIWGGAAPLLSDRLAGSSSTQEMAQIMEEVLRPVEAPDSVQQALWRLSATSVPLSQLVSETGLSLRHFRRACVERTGVSPKYLRRILRFRKTAKRIRCTAANGAEPCWAQLAIAAGYYDQARFIREFQEFAGSTPGRFLQSLLLPSGLESKSDEPRKSRKSNRLH